MTERTYTPEGLIVITQKDLSRINREFYQAASSRNSEAQRKFIKKCVGPKPNELHYSLNTRFIGEGLGFLCRKNIISLPNDLTKDDKLLNQMYFSSMFIGYGLQRYLLSDFNRQTLPKISREVINEVDYLDKRLSKSGLDEMKDLIITEFSSASQNNPLYPYIPENYHSFFNLNEPNNLLNEFLSGIAVGNYELFRRQLLRNRREEIGSN